MGHNDILPECADRLGRVESKVDTLIENTNKINGRYDKHLEESQVYRQKVIVNEENIKSVKGTKALVITNLIALIVASLSLAFYFGKQVQRIENIEKNQLVNMGSAKFAGTSY